MALRLYLIFGLLVFVKSTTVVVYEHSNYKGATGTCSNLEPYSHCELSNMDNRASSMAVTKGTCALIYDLKPPGGWVAIVKYPNLYVAGFQSQYNDDISSIKKCPRTRITRNCPVGTFAKKLDFVEDIYGKFRMSCFAPGNRTHAAATLYSHPSTSGSYISTTNCLFGAIRGLNYEYASTYEIYFYPQGNCLNNGQKTCGHNQAVCGFTTEVETDTGFLKSVSIRCCDVGDPAQFCDPADFYRPIMTCDNLEAAAPTTCRYSQTIGYGTSSSSSESHMNEKRFYQEMGYSFGAAGNGLSSNFHHNLGYSETTQFSWNNASSETWKSEVSHSVDMTIPGCMKSVLMQVEGQCSFFSAKANYFKRVDTCCNGPCNITESFFTQDDLLPMKKDEDGEGAEDTAQFRLGMAS